MKATAKYHFGKRLNNWAIWDNEGRKIMTVFSFEEAVRQTYLLNGWGEPKSINRKF